MLNTLVPMFMNGLTLISILMLVALGLAIIFGLMNVINLAHGEFVTIGAYSVAAIVALNGNFWLALVLAPCIGFVLGLAIERSIIQHLYARPTAAILATWGLSLIIQQTIQLVFGATPQHVTAPFSGTMSILGVYYPTYRFALICFAGVIVAGCLIVFRQTRFGLDMRAIIQNREMAEALGIDTRRIYMLGFASGAALAALAGALISPLTVVIAQMGVNYLARSFFVVIVGGAGSIGGVAAGAGLVGGLETVLNYQVPATVSQALVLVMAVIIIRFRPQGLVAPR